MRASDPVRASSSRPRARYTQPSPSERVQGDAQPGTGLVGDRMQRQQRLTQSVVPPDRQVLERHLGALAKDAKLSRDQIGHRAGTVLRPGAPAAARLLDRLRPVAKAARGPVAGLGEDIAKRLRTGQHHIREREHIRRPLQESIRDRGSAGGVPRRRWCRLAHDAHRPTRRRSGHTAGLQSPIHPTGFGCLCDGSPPLSMLLNPHLRRDRTHGGADPGAVEASSLAGSMGTRSATTARTATRRERRYGEIQPTSSLAIVPIGGYLA